MAAAAPTASKRFFGIGAGQYRARSGRLSRAEALDRAHPLRRLDLVPRPRAAVPLTNRHQQQEQAQYELEDADPGGWLAVAARVARSGDRQHDDSDHGQPDQPADDE